MANRWGIPKEVEEFVLERDKCCVYCRSPFTESRTSRKGRSSWEHIINDIRFNTRFNVALCCVSCNSSKGSKLLNDWFESNYCVEKNINKETVANVVKDVLNSSKVISFPS